MNNMNSNHEQMMMIKSWTIWIQYERLLWRLMWLDMVLNLTASSNDCLHVFLPWSRSCCRVCGCCWSTLKSKLQEFEFHWMNSKSGEFSLRFDLNICIHILEYEFHFENYFIHGIHSFILLMTCKNIALACNTTLDDGGREVYSLSSSNKHVNHYKHCLENKSKYDRQT